MNQAENSLPFCIHKKEQAQVLRLLKQNPIVYKRFLELSEPLQKELVEFYEGNRGLKITYDPFFKAIFNPELYPKRLSRFLSAILNTSITVKRMLSSESNRLSAESSLLIMDILVEMENGELVNVEMQKIGYSFPGERAACYSSDLILRQYNRQKGNKNQKFSYRNMKKTFTIILIEKSGAEFHQDNTHFLHHSRQIFDTKLALNLLQEYIFIPLDIFLDNYYRSGQNIDRELDAWLLFLISDNPSDISHLIEKHPWLKELYADIFEFQRHPEELVNMYSKALEILDRNTVQYMIEEQQKEIEENAKALEESAKALEENAKELELKDKTIELLQEKLDKLEHQYNIILQNLPPDANL